MVVSANQKTCATVEVSYGIAQTIQLTLLAGAEGCLTPSVCMVVVQSDSFVVVE